MTETYTGERSGAAPVGGANGGLIAGIIAALLLLAGLILLALLAFRRYRRNQNAQDPPPGYEEATAAPGEMPEYTNLSHGYNNHAYDQIIPPLVPVKLGKLDKLDLEGPVVAADEKKVGDMGETKENGMVKVLPSSGELNAAVANSRKLKTTGAKPSSAEQSQRNVTKY